MNQSLKHTHIHTHTPEVHLGETHYHLEASGFWHFVSTWEYLHSSLMLPFGKTFFFYKNYYSSCQRYKWRIIGENRIWVVAHHTVYYKGCDSRYSQLYLRWGPINLAFVFILPCIFAFVAWFLILLSLLIFIIPKDNIQSVKNSSWHTL